MSLCSMHQSSLTLLGLRATLPSCLPSSLALSMFSPPSSPFLVLTDYSCNLHWSEVRDGWKPRNVVNVVCDSCGDVYMHILSGFAWSWGPLGWLVPSEIFPLEIRSSAQSVTVAAVNMFTFVVAQIFVTTLCCLKFRLFIFFAGFVKLMTMFIYFFPPETKAIPIGGDGYCLEDTLVLVKFCHPKS
ncbi:hypothetical protein QN277_020116 [Acacia crassicarpa]|uniref:Uncharacterized protein n=1 Tax=Acacia crassicarpa TaxID=499986 RepID=A0AAE1JJ48_9FABA|nr:hypothetical protein QN277_020116 [Acacia crassicarpa]